MTFEKWVSMLHLIITLIVVFVCIGEAPRNDHLVIPYVPFPINPATGAPTRTQLKAIDPHKLKFGDSMDDPETGLSVPVLAMTIHPDKGAVIPIGGSHVDPITGLPIAIELGGMMIDPQAGIPIPVLSVGIDPVSGCVVPIGGCHMAKDKAIPILPGDVYADPLSNKKVRVGGAFLHDDEVLPSAGGNQALLDSRVLACEARLLDVLRALAEALAGESRYLKREHFAL